MEIFLQLTRKNTGVQLKMSKKLCMTKEIKDFQWKITNPHEARLRLKMWVIVCRKLVKIETADFQQAFYVFMEFSTASIAVWWIRNLEQTWWFLSTDVLTDSGKSYILFCDLIICYPTTNTQSLNSINENEIHELYRYLEKIYT